MLLCVLHHMFPSVNHFMQKMSNANGSFSVQGTWDTNMAFLAELNEETPKGWFHSDTEGVCDSIITSSSPPSHLHLHISTCTSPPPLSHHLIHLHLHLFISTCTSPPAHLHLHISTTIITSSYPHPSPPLHLHLHISTCTL